MGSKIRSTYAWLLLSVIMLTLFPVAWLFEKLTASRDPGGDRLRIMIARWVSLYARWTPLYTFTVEGRDRLPQDRPFVLVANHESGLDVLTMTYLKTRARFLAESWIFDVPLMGPFMRRSRHIGVEIGNRESGRAALAEAERVLEAGCPVMIFPEGVLSPDEMAPFRPGAFVLAKRAGVPIFPVLLEGTGKAWRPGTLVVQGAHQIRIAVLPAIPAPVVAQEDAEKLSDMARSAIVAARRID